MSEPDSPSGGRMRYLVLSADYTQSALRDEYTGTVVPEEVGLPEGLAKRIREWNERYRQIIPLDEEQRHVASAVKLIELLDEEGLSIAAEIRITLPDAKVQYFSEGHLRQNPFNP